MVSELLEKRRFVLASFFFVPGVWGASALTLVEIHCVNWSINPPSKAPLSLFCQAPLKYANCPSPPFSAIAPYILNFSEPLPPSKLDYY